MELAENEVHVWSARLELEPRAADPRMRQLDAREQQRLARITRPELRARYVAARSFLRDTLARYLDTAPAAVPIEIGPHGKPFLTPHPALPPLQFNLSHSGDCAMLALTRTAPVGVDIEQMRPGRDALAVAKRFFAPAETEALRRLSDPQRRLAFYACWTRKEAFVKALGEGLTRSLNTFEVSVALETPKLLAVHWAADEIERWKIEDLYTGANRRAALAVALHAPTVLRLQWPMYYRLHG